MRLMFFNQILLYNQSFFNIFANNCVEIINLLKKVIVG
jgi:hypothetical protein